MKSPPRHSAESEDAPDPVRDRNFTDFLQHLRNYPEDDLDCVLELKLPMSMMIQLLQRGGREGSNPPEIIRRLLEREGMGAVSG